MYADSGNGWISNIDVKYIDNDTIRTVTGALTGTTDATINPWAYGVELSKSF